MLPVAPTRDILPLFEARLRFERRIDRDFNRSASDNRSDALGRFRAGFVVTRGPYEARLLYQVAEDEAWTRPRNFMTERRDVVIGYVQQTFKSGRLIVGRQRLREGNGRLIGESDWNNVSNSFDVVRWLGPKWEFFSGRLGASFRPDHRTWLNGVAFHGKLNEALLLTKHFPGADVYTLDVVHRVRSGRATFDTEWAIQTGRVGDRRLEAWAGSNRLTYSLNGRLAIFGDLTVASGGNTPNVVRTFEQGFAGYHGVHGISDLQGWRNMQMAAIGIRERCSPRVELTVTAYRFGLRDARDAWYGSAGLPNRGANGVLVSPTGAFGRDVGQELNLDVRWQASKPLTIQSGIAVFTPGRFVRGLAGSPKADQTFAYVQTSWRF